MSSTSTRSFSKWPVGSPEYMREDVGGRTIAVSITFMVLELFLTILRFLSQRVKKAEFGLDSVFIIPSLIFCWAISILAILMVEIGGSGKHLPAVAMTDPGKIIHWGKLLVAVEEIYCIAVIFPKLTILSFYLRIFSTKPYRIAAYVIGGLLTANGVAGVITSLLSCIPLAGRWDTALVAAGQAKCINIDEFWRWISFANILTDVVMLGLPLPAIWGLHTSKNQKMGLTVIFLTGSVGLVSSIVRFAIFFDTEGFIDGTWTSANLMIWTVVEPGIYHIAACLPSLRVLYMWIFKGSRGLTGANTRNTYGTNLDKSGTKDIPLVGRKVTDSGFVRLEYGNTNGAQQGYQVNAYGNGGKEGSFQSNSSGGTPQKDTRKIVVTREYNLEQSHYR